MGQKGESPFFVRVYRGGVTTNWFTCGLHGGAGQFWGEEKKQKKTEEEMSERGRLVGHVMDLFGERVHVGDSEP